MKKAILFTLLGLSITGAAPIVVALAKQEPIVKPALTQEAKRQAIADCALRVNASLQRGEIIGTAPMTYMSDTALLNVHIDVMDSFRRKVRDSRCVYTQDGRAYVRGG